MQYKDEYLNSSLEIINHIDEEYDNFATLANISLILLLLYLSISHESTVPYYWNTNRGASQDESSNNFFFWKC